MTHESKTNKFLQIAEEHKKGNKKEKFQGTFSESHLGKKLAENLASTLKVKSMGKSSIILKQTKSVGIIINGKFYSNSITIIFFF